MRGMAYQSQVTTEKSNRDEVVVACKKSLSIFTSTYVLSRRTIGMPLLACGHKMLKSKVKLS